MTGHVIRIRHHAACPAHPAGQPPAGLPERMAQALLAGAEAPVQKLLEPSGLRRDVQFRHA